MNSKTTTGYLHTNRYNFVLSVASLLSFFVFIIHAEISVGGIIRDNPNQDIFEQMDQDMREQWSHNYHYTLSERAIQLMKPIEEVVQIQVMLVGFKDISISSNVFSSYIDRIQHIIPVHVVHSQKLSKAQAEEQFDPSDDFDHDKKVNKIMKNEQIKTGGTGNVLVNRVVHYKVSEGTSSLETKFSQVLQAYTSNLNLNSNSNGAPIIIPYAEIDDLIEDEFQKSKKRLGPNSIVIYMLNSGIPRVPYYYSNNALNGECASSMQAGKSRWLWLDLAAGPISWGPRFGGEGLVTSTLVPFIGNYYSKSTSVLNTLEITKSGKTQLMSDLAAWIRRSVELLICPAVDHFPFLLSLSRPPERTVVQLVMFHDHPIGEVEKYGMFKANVISKVLEQIPTFPDQQIVFSASDISLHDDIHAATVFLNSLRDYVYADSVENDGQTIYHSHQYLDSGSLHYWLQRLQQYFFPQSPQVHYVPVFLFDFSHTDMMLLDRKHQVVSFPDMIIGVQNEEDTLRVPFKCNQRVISVDGRNVTRELLGGLVQSLWGVLPTGQYWSDSHQRLETDFMWNVGRTPFGPFSNHAEFSFVQYDGIYRPQLYQLINQTLTHVLEPLLDVRSYGFELHSLLNENEYDEFVIRWNLFIFKLKECGEEMALYEWTDAYYYVRSAFKDSEVLLTLLLKAKNNISPILQCDQNITSSNNWVYGVIFLGVIVAVVMLGYIVFCKSNTSKYKKV